MGALHQPALDGSGPFSKTIRRSPRLIVQARVQETIHMQI